MATKYKMENGQRVLMTDAEEADITTSTTPPTALKIALTILRRKRNKLLIETDWMANSDVTMSDDWKTYRQALRDLPSGLDTVEKVNAKEFPTKPGEQ
jgi:hypothetical protein